MSFYYYKKDPDILASFDAPSIELKNFLALKFESLAVSRFFAYHFNKFVNGRAFARKLVLSNEEALNNLTDKLNCDYQWADDRGYMVEIRVCWHIERYFGLSVFLCMKQLDIEGQGWVMLEQVLIKRPKNLCSWWTYAD